MKGQSLIQILLHSRGETLTILRIISSSFSILRNQAAAMQVTLRTYTQHQALKLNWFLPGNYLNLPSIVDFGGVIREICLRVVILITHSIRSPARSKHNLAPIFTGWLPINYLIRGNVLTQSLLRVKCKMGKAGKIKLITRTIILTHGRVKNKAKAKQVTLWAGSQSLIMNLLSVVWVSVTTTNMIFITEGKK